MYKLLLCLRYLRTRYIALACIISVMLGVATMIVVNSVMQGFATEMRARIKGMLSDVVLRGLSMDGFPDSEKVMREIRRVLGDKVVAMSPMVEVPGVMNIKVGPRWIAQPVDILGVDVPSRTAVGEFANHVVDDGDPPRHIPPSFEVTRGMRRVSPEFREMVDDMPANPGCIVGFAVAAYRNPEPDEQGKYKDLWLIRRGTDVKLTFPTAGPSRNQPPRAIDDALTATGFFKSGMSEYDSHCVFVPLKHLQDFRNMGENVTSINIKLRDYADADAVVETLRQAFNPGWFTVETWENRQGPLLAAVSVETGILNVLLFMIIGVAGFGILAIFFMIVVEKTRDIGVLKALGASSRGVLGIFLGYGLALGAVGSGIGLALGLTFVRYINEIERGLSVVTGHKIFDDRIYYFDKIPTVVEPRTVGLILLGALLIAVGASILPARRAARLRPVEALRYE